MMSSVQEQATGYLKRQGFLVWPAPNGFVIRTPPTRSHDAFIQINRDEMDAILTLGRIRLLEALSTEIRIEVDNHA